MRLIDADALQMSIANNRFSEILTENEAEWFSGIIRNAPTIDAEPIYTFNVKTDDCEKCAYKKIIEGLSIDFEDYLIHGERREP